MLEQATKTQAPNFAGFKRRILMELLDLNAAIRLEIKEIDVAIEKAERLISLLRELQKMAGSIQ